MATMCEPTDPAEAGLAVLRAFGCLVGVPDAEAKEIVSDVLDAAEAAQERANQCDEPGCEKPACLGFPLPDGGYRRTCSEHGKHAYG